MNIIVRIAQSAKMSDYCVFSFTRFQTSLQHCFQQLTCVNFLLVQYRACQLYSHVSPIMTQFFDCNGRFLLPQINYLYSCRHLFHFKYFFKRHYWWVSESILKKFDNNFRFHEKFYRK